MATTSWLLTAFGDKGCGGRWWLVPVLTEPEASVSAALDDAGARAAEGCQHRSRDALPCQHRAGKCSRGRATGVLYSHQAERQPYG
jgi:hypothetical protein